MGFLIYEFFGRNLKADLILSYLARLVTLNVHASVTHNNVYGPEALSLELPISRDLL